LWRSDRPTTEAFDPYVIEALSWHATPTHTESYGDSLRARITLSRTDAYLRSKTRKVRVVYELKPERLGEVEPKGHGHSQ